MATSNARSAADEYVLEHPTLGSMTGVVHTATPDIVQFRGIPYATLPGRFMRSMIRENIDGMSRDFTKPGYACPHTFDMDDIHSGGSYPGQQPIRASELDSLILEVSVPRSHLESQNSKSWERLPVMTYIHGGAFVLGKIDAHHNAAYMAQHSLAIARPVITAAIQYRLGALGFMATPDGGKNLGLWDQRNALTWIQQFINGFGGDKRRVTLFGESAGGYSICCHMLSHQPYSGPLFSRVIIMSGVMGPMLTPISEDKASKAFEDVCHNLGIQERGEAAMDKLRALDVQKLVSANDTWIAKGNMWSPVDDPSFFRTKVTWDNVHEILGSCEGLDGMIVGNTGFEGLAYPSVAYSMTPKSFLEHLKRELSNDAVEKVLKAYNVTLDMDQTLFLTSAMRWCGDIIFDAPIHAFSKHISRIQKKKLFRYVFDVRNPFPDAPFFQQPHHWVDVYFLFRTMQFRFPYRYLKDISDKHAALWISFANGEEPWSEFSDTDQGIIMVADERQGWVEKTMPEYEKMSGLEYARLDSLWEAWQEKTGESWLPLDMLALKT